MSLNLSPQNPEEKCVVKSLSGTTLSQRVVLQELGVILKHIGAREHREQSH